MEDYVVKSVDILLKDNLIKESKEKTASKSDKIQTFYTRKYENTNFSPFGPLVSKQVETDPPFSIPG